MKIYLIISDPLSRHQTKNWEDEINSCILETVETKFVYYFPIWDTQYKPLAKIALVLARV